MSGDPYYSNPRMDEKDLAIDRKSQETVRLGSDVINLTVRVLRRLGYEVLSPPEAEAWRKARVAAAREALQSELFLSKVEAEAVVRGEK